MHGAFLAQAMLLGLGFEAASKATLDEFQKNVEQTARQTRTLHIEFSIKQHDLVFDQTEEYVGTLKLRRLANGKVLIRCEAKPKPKGEPSRLILLIEDELYLLNDAEKTAAKFDLSKVDKLQLISDWVTPFVLILDKERMKQRYCLRVRKRDKWYSYLTIEPKKPEPWKWFSGGKRSGCVVVMNKASGEIPAGMPRQFRFETGIGESLIDIHKWKTNSPDGPEEVEFQRPEKMAGWKILTWDDVGGK